jgi:putative sterol carrier protein
MMANESSDVGMPAAPLSGVAPDLAGVHGKIRLEVAGNPVGTLVVEGTHVELTPDTNTPADATFVVASGEYLRKLIKGELNPFIASMRGWALAKGDRHLVTRVVLGLQSGSPFAGVGKAG